MSESHTSSADKHACFYMCSCRLTHNFFVPSVREHFYYDGDDQAFLMKHASIATVQDVLAEVKRQRIQRQRQPAEALERAELVAQGYKRLHPEVYTLDRERFLTPEFRSIVSTFRACAPNPRAVNACVADLKNCGLLVEIRDGLWTFSMFTLEFCKLLEEELAHFEASGLPKARPNSMNRHGILLPELGFNEHLFDQLLLDIDALGSKFFPFHTETLDSYRVFTVKYDYEADGDRDLALHFDNAEVTFNVNIGGKWDGGQVKFFGDFDKRTDPNLEASVTLQRGHAVIHAGIELHQAEPITAGQRHNLIIWCRSSGVRNDRCPMCLAPPKVVPTNCYMNEGFSCPPCTPMAQ